MASHRDCGPFQAVTLSLLFLTPLVGAGLVLATRLLRRDDSSRRRTVLVTAIGVSIVLATLAVACTIALAGGPATAFPPAAGWSGWGPYLTPRLVLAGFSRVMIVLIPAIAAPVVLYAGTSMRDDPGLPRLVALLVAFTGAMELLVSADDLLALLVGWELVGACSWALIGYEWRDQWRVRDARTAFLATRAGDLGLYLSAAALFGATGSLRFEAIASLHGTALSVVAAGILVASAAKSAQLPFSPWLFAAMAGPTPASALLHSATMVASGAYLLVRLEPVLAAVEWFAPAVAALGLATALTGGVVASIQSDLKKALAASTSAQYGLMFVAIGAGFTAAAGVHLIAHAAYKALLFLCAGVVLHASSMLDLRVLAKQRLGRMLKGVALLFGVGTLALAAVPPLGGAYSKEQILTAAAHRSTWLALGVLVAGFLSAFYAGRLQLLSFGAPFARSDEWEERPKEAGTIRRTTPPSATEIAALVALAAVSIALGLLWLPGATPLVEAATGGHLARGAAWQLCASIASIALAAFACWILWRRDALVTLGFPERVRGRMADWLGLPAATRRVVAEPVHAFARALDAMDRRVIDTGIRAVAGLSALLSRELARWGERGMDGVVMLVARATTRTAHVAWTTDDAGIDAAVEGLAREVGVVGTQGRRLQTGLAHQYYVILAVGALFAVAAAAAGALWGR